MPCTSCCDLEYAPVVVSPRNQGWRFNVVMVLISMFYGMMLTNWGDINEDGESSDPKNGWTAMWLTTTGQWVCYIIYAWTLVAPLVFPDRDFS